MYSAVIFIDIYIMYSVVMAKPDFRMFLISDALKKFYLRKRFFKKL